MRPLAIVAILISLIVQMNAQQHVANHQKELQRLRTSIESTRQRINELNRRETKAMSLLSTKQRQQKNVNKVIATLSNQLRLLEDSLHVIESTITETKASITSTNARWKQLTRHMYQNIVAVRGSNRTSQLAPYLYTRSTRSTMALRNQLSSRADSLAHQMEYLGELTDVRSLSLKKKEQDKALLSKALTQQAREVQTVRASKQALEEELRKKQQSASKIRTLIEQLVAQERKRAEEEKRRTTTKAESKAKSKAKTKGKEKGSTVDKQESTISKSAPQRGPFKTKSLPWPTPNTTLLHGYGTYKNPTTGTSHENPGIDIKAPTGTGVSCVAKGQVSTVTWLPGFGSLVIVDHQNGFRTVYANLASVNVQRGSTVSQGTRIGVSGSNLDGNLVHFEVWIDGKRINPLTYLR